MRLASGFGADNFDLSNEADPIPWVLAVPSGAPWRYTWRHYVDAILKGLDRVRETG
jgi:hypothetical protein